MKTNPCRKTFWGFVKYRTTAEGRTCKHLLCKLASAIVRFKKCYLLKISSRKL